MSVNTRHQIQATVASSPMDDAWRRTLADAPIPGGVSREAKALMAAGLPLPEADAHTLAEHRAICEQIQQEIGSRQGRRYAVSVADDVIAGVPVRIFTPADLPQENRSRVFLNCHGGAFAKDSGSLTENIPIAGLTRTVVVAVRYRLAPEHPFPAAVEDVAAVYEALLGRFEPERIGLYGTSAGAILSAQTLVRLQHASRPMPAALGFFSGAADLARAGDSEYFFPLVDDPRPVQSLLEPYLRDRDLTDPEVSPIYADLRGFPPTLCITGTRDMMLSQTALFQRALLAAGVDARLVVFEAMPHAHWSYLELPESDEAFRIMGAFLADRLAAS